MAIDNRAALLKGARQCLEQIGYARTTARDVARAAGVSLGAIGYHFGSKEELLLEAIAESVRDWIARFAQLALDVETHGADFTVREAIPEFFRLIEDSRPLLVAWVEALAQSEHSNALRAQLAEQYAQFRISAAAMLTTTIGPQLESVGLDPNTVSSLLIALGDGLILQSLIDPEAAPGSKELLAIYSSLTGTSGEPATPPT
jgi:AcrR family transcriptional regulator